MNFKEYISRKMMARSAKVPIDARMKISGTEFICIWSPYMNKYALIKTDGSGMSGMGWCAKITYDDVYKYYSLCTIDFDGFKPITPGTHIRDPVRKVEYSIAYSCGTWKLVNCVSGDVVNTLSLSKCELNADDVRELVDMPAMYVIDV